MEKLDMTINISRNPEKSILINDTEYCEGEDGIKKIIGVNIRWGMIEISVIQTIDELDWHVTYYHQAADGEFQSKVEAISLEFINGSAVYMMYNEKNELYNMVISDRLQSVYPDIYAKVLARKANTRTAKKCNFQVL